MELPAKTKLKVNWTQVKSLPCYIAANSQVQIVEMWITGTQFYKRILPKKCVIDELLHHKPTNIYTYSAESLNVMAVFDRKFPRPEVDVVPGRVSTACSWWRRTLVKRKRSAKRNSVRSRTKSATSEYLSNSVAVLFNTYIIIIIITTTYYGATQPVLINQSINQSIFKVA